MAIANEILTGRFGQLLTRIFSMKGGNPAPQLSPEVQSTFELNDLDSWDAFLAQEDLCCASDAVPAHAATFSAIALVNPTGSGVLLRVRLSRAYSSPASLIHVAPVSESQVLGGSWVNAGVPSQFCDTRRVGKPVGQLVDNNNLGTPFNTQGVLCYSNGQLDRAEIGGADFVISPGFALVISAETVNCELHGSFAWTERAAVPSELA